MIIARSLLAAAVLASLATASLAATKAAPTLRDRQQAACAADAQRLCADALPDPDKTAACMKTKKAEVSKKCAAMYK